MSVCIVRVICLFVCFMYIYVCIVCVDCINSYVCCFYYSLNWDIAPRRELLSFVVVVFCGGRGGDGLYRYKRVILWNSFYIFLSTVFLRYRTLCSRVSANGQTEATGYGYLDLGF